MSKKIDRTGETHIMNSGLAATIINYRNAMDIDIMFDNGQTVQSICYSNFCKGKAKCPLIIECVDNHAIAINPNLIPALIFLIDTNDIHLVKHSYWCRDNHGYVRCRKHGKLHRLIMCATPDELVDHINGNVLDCRKNNLRKCNHAENHRNKNAQSNNTSGFKGVSWNKNAKKWSAKIGTGEKYLHLGYFENKNDAALAYNDAAVKFHGKFARLNNIEPPR